MPNESEINCTIIIYSECGYHLNKIMDANKIEEMMQKLFKKTNTILEEKISKTESSISNIKSNINTVQDDLKMTLIT